MGQAKREQPAVPAGYRDKSRSGHRRRHSAFWRFGPLVLGLSALALIVGAVWLAASQEPAADSPTAPPGPVGVPADVKLGAPAPDFNVPTLDGKTFSLSSQRGRPTLILIMAYWCGNCLPEARAMTRLHQEYGDRITLVALDVDPSSTAEDLKAFKAIAGDGDYVWAFDVGQRVANAYRVRSLDTTFIIDQDGTLVYQDTYPTPYETLKAELEKLLQ
jgi:peroxiredoxin